AAFSRAVKSSSCVGFASGSSSGTSDADCTGTIHSSETGSLAISSTISLRDFDLGSHMGRHSSSTKEPRIQFWIKVVLPLDPNKTVPFGYNRNINRAANFLRFSCHPFLQRLHTH